ncbi:MAG: DUF3824 domain-containing protein [Terricaulis sp.]
MLMHTLLALSPIFAVIAFFAALVRLSENKVFLIGLVVLGVAVSCALAALPLAFGRPIELTDAASAALVTAVIYFSACGIGIGAAEAIKRRQRLSREEKRDR